MDMMTRMCAFRDNVIAEFALRFTQVKIFFKHLAIGDGLTKALAAASVNNIRSENKVDIAAIRHSVAPFDFSCKEGNGSNTAVLKISAPEERLSSSRLIEYPIFEGIPPSILNDIPINKLPAFSDELHALSQDKLERFKRELQSKEASGGKEFYHNELSLENLRDERKRWGSLMNFIDRQGNEHIQEGLQNLYSLHNEKTKEEDKQRELDNINKALDKFSNRIARIGDQDF